MTANWAWPTKNWLSGRGLLTEWQAEWVWLADCFEREAIFFLSTLFPPPFQVLIDITGPVFWMHWQNVCYVTNCFLLYFGVIFLLFISDRFFFISLEVKLYINIDNIQKIFIFLILLWFKFFFFICVWKQKNFQVLFFFLANSSELY